MKNPELSKFQMGLSDSVFSNKSNHKELIKPVQIRESELGSIYDSKDCNDKIESLDMINEKKDLLFNSQEFDDDNY